MQKALIYCRVSTEEQAREGYSLDAQEKYCRKYADNNGFNISQVFRDEGKSGTNVDRPALQDLLTKCQKDKSVKAVIIQETDRLARNTKDHLTIRAILKKAEVKLISVAQPMLDDSPEGNMIDTIIASVNQFSSDLNSRKTKKGMQERFDNGWFPGYAKLGYLNKEVNENRIIVKDPQRWDFIKEALRMYLTGNYSAIEISEILYKKGLTSRTGKRICNSIMITILKDPFYAGIMKWSGQEKMGRHEVMITPEEHKAILAIKDAHNNHACRRRIHNFLLRGFVFCGFCGQRYTAERHRENKNTDYYHCSAVITKHTNKGQNIETEELEKQVQEHFKNIEFSKEFIDLIIQKVKRVYEEKKSERGVEKRILLNKIMKIEENREKIENKLLLGTLIDEDYVRMRDRFKNETAKLQEKVSKIDEQREIDVDVARETLLLARDIYGAYKKAPYELKRLYLSLFWNKFLVKNKKIIKAEPTELIKVFLKERRKFTTELRTDAENKTSGGEVFEGFNINSPENKGRIILTPNLLRW